MFTNLLYYNRNVVDVYEISALRSEVNVKEDYDFEVIDLGHQ
ncbi:MAG: hypothetical protein QXR45_08755 [Candidatus Bathyarchaeia archaeon]